MINKLLLVRVHGANRSQNSTLLDRAGVRAFVKNEAVEVRPLAWHEEHGESHYAWVVEGMNSKELAELYAWVKTGGDDAGVSLHEYDGDLVAALAAVGLVVHESK